MKLTPIPTYTYLTDDFWLNDGTIKELSFKVWFEEDEHYGEDIDGNRGTYRRWITQVEPVAHDVEIDDEIYRQIEAYMDY